MAKNRIILLLTLLGGTGLLGCQQFTQPGAALVDACPPAPATGQLWCEPAIVHDPCASYPGPIYLEPGVEPGAVLVQPPVMMQQPLVPYAAPQQPVAQQPGWWDVLPQGSAAISPDFGLPRGPRVENPLPNPLVVPVSHHELAWDQLADVVSNYFPLQSEQPVQQMGGMLTEGFIETPFQVGATLLEPQRNDSVGSFNRWQSTLQSIRRKATINVQPTAGGYAIRVHVVKQLEDLPRPEGAPSGASVLLTGGSLPSNRTTQNQPTNGTAGWIDLGRDEPLEQEMLRRIQERLAAPVTPSASQPLF